MIRVACLLSLLLVRPSLASPSRMVYLSNEDMASISLAPGRTTVLSFPTRPTKVILGNQGIIAIQYIENDLAISPLTSSARTNLFVYLEGRRFAFDLRAKDKACDEIVLVRDRASRGRTKP